jgi:hypothetical protein
MQTGTFTEATRPTVPGNILTLMIAKARETTQEDGTLRSLVFEDTLPQRMGTTYNSPKLGALTYEGLTQGEDITNFQQLTTSNVVITPGEAGLATKFSKKSLSQWTENMAVRTGRIMRDARDRKIDADIGGLSASFTTYTLGAATTALTVGHLIAGKARLKGGNNVAGSAIAAGAVSNQAPRGQIWGAFRWESLTQVMRSLAGGPTLGTVITTSVAASGGPGSKQNEVLDDLYVGKVGGVQLYGNSNFAKDSSDDAVTMIGHRDAIAFVPFPHDGVTGGGAPFVRDSDDGRSLQMTSVDDYGFGVLDQNYAIACTFDATAATS